MEAGGALLWTGVSMCQCRVWRVSVVNCGSRLCTVVAMRVGGPAEQHLVVEGRNDSLRLDCQRVIHLFKKKKKKKKKKTAAKEEDYEEEEEDD